MLAIIVDDWHGISLTRILSIYFGKMAVDVSIETKHISGNAVIVIVFCLAAAFGKGVFVLALEKWRATVASKDETKDVTLDVNIEETIRREVDARRDAGKEFGVEAAP